MAIITYSYKNDKSKKLTPHFAVWEFKCPTVDKILINEELPVVLEKLYVYLDKKYGLKMINVNSGYRTPEYSVKVGGFSTDQHTKGSAADITVYGKNGKIIHAKYVCAALEDLKFNGGVGYICSTATHIDVKNRKFYFDETKGDKGLSSFYTYFNIPKEEVKEVDYTLLYSCTKDGDYVIKLYNGEKLYVKKDIN